MESILQAQGLDLYLTTRRIIVYGTDRVFLVIPSGRKIASAYLEDVDSAAVRTKRLPQWLLLIGLVAILVSLIGMATVEDDGFSDSGRNRSDYAAPLIVGIVLSGLWILIKKEEVVFTVAGAELLVYDAYRAPTGEDTVGQFLNAYYDLRPELSTIVSRRTST